MTDTAARKTSAYHLCLISLLILAVYGNTLFHGFVWDDNEVIVTNPSLTLGNILRFFLMEDVAAGPTGYYRPVTYISFALDRAIWGLNPIGFNITNLALHILASLLFYRMLAARFSDDRLALFATLIFSLHPIAGESVNFHAGGRNTMLCACFSLASLHAYMGEKRRSSLLFFILAIFSKEFGLLVPALFLLHDVACGRWREKGRWTGYLPFLAAIACYLTLRSIAVAQGNLLKTINITENFWIVPQTVISYLQLMIAPVNLKTLYDVNNQITWTSFICYSLLLLALIAAAVLFRRQREVLFGISMFLLFMLPVTNLFPLGTAMMADRYAYLSLFGFSLVLACGINHLPRQAATVIIIGLCLLYIPVDVRRNGYWKNEETFFSRMTRDAPDVFVGFMNLGYTYFGRNDYTNAERNLAVIHTKKDVTTSFLVQAARTLREMERPQKAVPLLDRAIELDPGYYPAYVVASLILQEAGNTALAARYREKAAALPADRVAEMRQKALSLYRQGEDFLARQHLINAERSFNEALNHDPACIPALIALGKLIAAQGNPALARRYFLMAAAFDPGNPVIHHHLAQTCEAAGNRAEALKEMKISRELESRSPQKGAAVPRQDDSPMHQNRYSDKARDE